MLWKSWNPDDPIKLLRLSNRHNISDAVARACAWRRDPPVAPSVCSERRPRLYLVNLPSDGLPTQLDLRDAKSGKQGEALKNNIVDMGTCCGRGCVRESERDGASC